MPSNPGTTLDGVCVIDVASTSAKLLGLLPEATWLGKTAFNSGKTFSRLGQLGEMNLSFGDLRKPSR
jgi:hypothetical protein